MEELEKNETSTQAEENTVSLASAQALADALAKIEAYTPTTWVDNSSPDIDAEHLNKPEQAIKRVTDALNSAVDVIKDLQSQITKNSGAISDVNNNLSNGSVKSYFSPYKKNEADLCKGYNNSDGVFYFNYQGALVPIKKYIFSDGQGNGIFASDQLVKKDDLLISISGTGPTDWTALEITGNMPFKIWNVTKASTSKGAPSGCYDYGTLIALVATATGDRWRNTLIYLPDNNNNVGNKIYVRSGISTKWLAISGTDVNSVS